MSRLLLLLTLAVAAMAQNRNIVQIAQSDPNLSTLVDLIVTAGLVDALSGPGPFTVLAPTNQAFSRLPPGTIDTLKRPDHKNVLTYILEYHVTNVGAVRSTDLKQGEQIPMLDGENVTVTTADRTRVTFNGNSNVITANIVASNGIIHIVDNVLLPKNPPAPAPTENLYQVLTDLNLTLLLTCTKLCNLDGALQTGGPFTVFAPTNAAFEALGPELQRLLQNTTALCPIIEYHVVKGSVPSTALPNGQSYAPSLAGPIIFIEKGQGVELNCFSRVVSADNAATNGEIHVIDRVILPPTAL